MLPSVSRCYKSLLITIKQEVRSPNLTSELCINHDSLSSAFISKSTPEQWFSGTLTPLKTTIGKLLEA